MVGGGSFRSGFMHLSYGSGTPDSVTIVTQCRGDSYWSKCRPCFNSAVAGLRRRCPSNKAGMIWFDQCFLEFTTVDVVSRKDEIDYSNNFFLHNSKKVSGDAKLFNKETVALLEQLTLKAIDKNNKDDNQTSLYAAGEKRLGSNKQLYAMVQCTRFLFMDENGTCKICLDTIIREFPKCCYGKQGGRVSGTSCTFRYELYPFLRTPEKTV